MRLMMTYYCRFIDDAKGKYGLPASASREFSQTECRRVGMPEQKTRLARA
jgi:hypothetical protein